MEAVTGKCYRMLRLLLGYWHLPTMYLSDMALIKLMALSFCRLFYRSVHIEGRIEIRLLVFIIISTRLGALMSKQNGVEV